MAIRFLSHPVALTPRGLLLVNYDYIFYIMCVITEYLCTYSGDSNKKLAEVIFARFICEKGPLCELWLS